MWFLLTRVALTLGFVAFDGSTKFENSQTPKHICGFPVDEAAFTEVDSAWTRPSIKGQAQQPGLPCRLEDSTRPFIVTKEFDLRFELLKGLIYGEVRRKPSPPIPTCVVSPQKRGGSQGPTSCGQLDLGVITTGHIQRAEISGMASPFG